MSPKPRSLKSVLALAVLLVPLAGPAAAQPADQRTPNVEGTWVTPSSSMFFSFLHRFSVGASPTYTVGNIPMIHLSGGFTDWLSLGALYATETVTVPGASHELELWGKQRLLDQAAGAPLSLSLKEAFNTTAWSPDAELAASRMFGPLGLYVAARAMGNYRYLGAPRLAGALGASYRLTPFLTLAGDLAASPMRQASEPLVAWGGGAQVAIPYTPHTLSLQVTNTGTDSIQGASAATDDVRFGFDFTVPLTNGARWLEIFVPAADRGDDVAALPPPGIVAPSPVPSAAAAPTSSAAAPSRFDAKAFYAANCAGCHGVTGQGGFGTNLKGIEAKDDAFIEMRIAKGSPKGMPGYRGQLPAAEMRILVDYIKGL